MADTTYPFISLFIKLSKGSPITAAGMHATRIFPQPECSSSAHLIFVMKMDSVYEIRISTARIAPN